MIFTASVRLRITTRSLSCCGRACITTRTKAKRPSNPQLESLFHYTSGRWVYNEKIRLQERYLKFNLPGLHSVIATATGHSATDLVSFTKLSDGKSSRTFRATFSDGQNAVARLPYPCTVPKRYTVASEVATMDYLRLSDIPTPKVYGSSSSTMNQVGAEYIVMEQIDGKPLSESWYTMTSDQQQRIMKQIVELQTRMMSLKFPASGSIYYLDDILQDRNIPLRDISDRKFCIGPIVQPQYWEGQRALSDPRGRGPWTSPNHIFGDVGKRELEWAKNYAKPRFLHNRAYRGIYAYQFVHPNEHIKNLTDYVELSQYLGFSPRSPLHRHVFVHPDLQPSNIIVSKSHDIVGLIGFQHSAVLPLGIAARFPAPFHNPGDSLSEMLVHPSTELPRNHESLSPAELHQAREKYRKQRIHYLYASFTRQMNPDYFEAIVDNLAIMHRKLFQHANTPWVGDSVSLKAELINAINNWLPLTASDTPGNTWRLSTPPSLDYSTAEINEIIHALKRQQTADAEIAATRERLGIAKDGWVSNENYDYAIKGIRELKEKMLAGAKTREDRADIENHFPFQDFSESGFKP
ncbi:aminoglycoside phosphotransferase family protein [Aspergillus stella-maris]|uniref:aminoglycoside phosphotransferase family protein n=1 Tax=Aspergillus stella-maris TaxID=1810926 RepID=UPI003CCE3634